MTLTDVQYQALAINEVGDDSDSTLASTVPLYWARHSDIADLELRYLYVKRDCIDLLLGPAKDGIDITSDGDTAKLSQRFAQLRDLRAIVEQLIDQASTLAGARGAAGELLQTAPVMPPAGSRVDANWSAYRGSPYYRNRRRIP